MKTILIKHVHGQETRAQVSDKATVTFGGLIPGAKVDGGSNRTALRVYEGKLQVAVFTGVESFRFLENVTILEKRVSQAAKDIVSEEGGVQRRKTVQVTTEDWVNPDQTKPDVKDADSVLKTITLEAQ